VPFAFSSRPRRFARGISTGEEDGGGGGARAKNGDPGRRFF